MTKVAACIVARTVSTRLPLKILRKLDKSDRSMIDFLIQRLKQVKSIDEIFICTSVESVDEILEDVAARNNVKIYRGSADQVIERLLAVGKLSGADVVLRITGDNPFTSYEYIDQQIEFLRSNNLDYVRLIDAPVGATAEAIRYDALVRCNEMMDPDVSEYMMLYMFEPRHFKCGVIKPFSQDYSAFSVTVDTPDDLRRTHMLVDLFKGDALKITLKEIISIYENNDLPASVMKASSKVKLPYGKEVSYEEFKNDMDRRINASLAMKLYEQA